MIVAPDAGWHLKHTCMYIISVSATKTGAHDDVTESEHLIQEAIQGDPNDPVSWLRGIASADKIMVHRNCHDKPNRTKDMRQIYR